MPVTTILQHQRDRGKLNQPEASEPLTTKDDNTRNPDDVEDARIDLTHEIGQYIRPPIHTGKEKTAAATGRWPALDSIHQAQLIDIPNSRRPLDEHNIQQNPLKGPIVLAPLVIRSGGRCTGQMQPTNHDSRLASHSLQQNTETSRPNIETQWISSKNHHNGLLSPTGSIYDTAQQPIKPLDIHDSQAPAANSNNSQQAAYTAHTNEQTAPGAYDTLQTPPPTPSSAQTSPSNSNSEQASPSSLRTSKSPVRRWVPVQTPASFHNATGSRNRRRSSAEVSASQISQSLKARYPRLQSAASRRLSMLRHSVTYSLPAAGTHGFATPEFSTASRSSANSHLIPPQRGAVVPVLVNASPQTTTSRRATTPHSEEGSYPRLMPAPAAPPQAPLAQQPIQSQPAYPQPLHVQPSHVQPPHVQPPHVQRPHSQPLQLQSSYAQPFHSQPAYPQSAHTEPSHSQPAHPEAADWQLRWPQSRYGTQMFLPDQSEPRRPLQPYTSQPSYPQLSTVPHQTGDTHSVTLSRPFGALQGRAVSQPPVTIQNAVIINGLLETPRERARRLRGEELLRREDVIMGRVRPPSRGPESSILKMTPSVGNRVIELLSEHDPMAVSASRLSHEIPRETAVHYNSVLNWHGQNAPLIEYPSHHRYPTIFDSVESRTAPFYEVPALREVQNAEPTPMHVRSMSVPQQIPDTEIVPYHGPPSTPTIQHGVQSHLPYPRASYRELNDASNGYPHCSSELGQQSRDEQRSIERVATPPSDVEEVSRMDWEAANQENRGRQADIQLATRQNCQAASEEVTRPQVNQRAQPVVASASSLESQNIPKNGVKRSNDRVPTPSSSPTSLTQRSLCQRPIPAPVKAARPKKPANQTPVRKISSGVQKQKSSRAGKAKATKAAASRVAKPMAKTTRAATPRETTPEDTIIVATMPRTATPRETTPEDTIIVATMPRTATPRAITPKAMTPHTWAPEATMSPVAIPLAETTQAIVSEAMAPQTRALEATMSVAERPQAAMSLAMLAKAAIQQIAIPSASMRQVTISPVPMSPVAIPLAETPGEITPEVMVPQPRAPKAKMPLAAVPRTATSLAAPAEATIHQCTMPPTTLRQATISPVAVPLAEMSPIAMSPIAMPLAEMSPAAMPPVAISSVVTSSTMIPQATMHQETVPQTMTTRINVSQLISPQIEAPQVVKAQTMPHRIAISQLISPEIEEPQVTIATQTLPPRIDISQLISPQVEMPQVTMAQAASARINISQLLSPPIETPQVTTTQTASSRIAISQLMSLPVEAPQATMAQTVRSLQTAPLSARHDYGQPVRISDSESWLARDNAAYWGEEMEDCRPSLNNSMTEYSIIPREESSSEAAGEMLGFNAYWSNNADCSRN